MRLPSEERTGFEPQRERVDDLAGLITLGYRVFDVVGCHRGGRAAAPAQLQVPTRPGAEQPSERLRPAAHQSDGSVPAGAFDTFQEDLTGLSDRQLKGDGGAERAGEIGVRIIGAETPAPRPRPAGFRPLTAKGDQPLLPSAVGQDESRQTRVGSHGL
jgi:hypothetical protein